MILVDEVNVDVVAEDLEDAVVKSDTALHEEEVHFLCHLRVQHYEVLSFDDLLHDLIWVHLFQVEVLAQVDKIEVVSIHGRLRLALRSQLACFRFNLHIPEVIGVVISGNLEGAGIGTVVRSSCVCSLKYIVVPEDGLDGLACFFSFFKQF